MENKITDFIEDELNEMNKKNAFYFWLGFIMGMTLALIITSVVYFFK